MFIIKSDTYYMTVCVPDLVDLQNVKFYFVQKCKLSNELIHNWKMKPTHRFIKTLKNTPFICLTCEGRKNCMDENEAISREKRRTL